jgi:hypothetical protein
MIARFFKRNWWVIAFILGCLMFYEKGLSKREQLYQQLTEQLANLQKEKNQAIIDAEGLETQIYSQTDLAWIELLLKKKLGVVPEDQQKFFFMDSTD